MHKNQKNILLAVVLIVFTLGLHGCSCSKANKQSKELAPGLYLGKLSTTEGNSGSNSTVTLDVTLQRENSETVTVDYRVTAIDPEGRVLTDLAIVDDGSDSTTGFDVVQSTGTISFLPADANLKKISLQISGDTFYEHDEAFLVELFNQSSGVDIVASSVEVIIQNDDPQPVVSFTTSNTELNETYSDKDNGVITTNASLLISLDSVSRIDSVIFIGSSLEPSVNNDRIDAKVGETAAYRIDYLLLNGAKVVSRNENVSVPAGTSELALEIEVIDDGDIENRERFFLTLNAVSDVVQHSTLSELELFITDNDQLPSIKPVPLNDTGVLKLVSFADANIDQEIDANIGFDAANLAKVGNGRAGFDYTKIDADGNDVAFSVQMTINYDNDGNFESYTIPWECAKDNVSGLVWEVKARDDGLRGDINEYTWYDPNYTTNGGNAGLQGASTCSALGSNCSTANYVADMNHIKLCGMTGWRLPTIAELRSLVDFGVGPIVCDQLNSESCRNVAYDADFFIGDGFGNRFVWSSTTDSANPERARALRFSLSAGLTEESRVKSTQTLNTIRVVNDSLIKTP